jgi:hypothetical protein
VQRGRGGDPQLVVQPYHGRALRPAQLQVHLGVRVIQEPNVGFQTEPGGTIQRTGCSVNLAIVSKSLS